MVESGRDEVAGFVGLGWGVKTCTVPSCWVGSYRPERFRVGQSLCQETPNNVAACRAEHEKPDAERPLVPEDVVVHRDA